MKDILFDGLPVDCTVTDFAGSAVCTILKEQAADLVTDGENRYLFSFFGGVSMNNTSYHNHHIIKYFYEKY